MKGLLLKDIYVLLYRYYWILVVSIILVNGAAFFAELGVIDETFFPVTYTRIYVMFLAGLFPFYIMSEEEKAGWDEYADALLVSRQDVVTARYITAIITVGGTALFMLVLQLTRLTIMGGEAAGPLRSLSMAAAFGFLYPALMLPCLFHFGVRRGLFVALILGVPLFLLNGFVEVQWVDIEGKPLMRLIEALGPLAYAVLAGALALFALSWRLSVRWYEKREL